MTHTAHRSQRAQITPTWVTIYLPVAIAVALRVNSESTASLSYVALSAFALMGRPQAILSLALSWLFTMINPEIAPDAGAFGRYLTLIAVTISAFIRSGFLSRHVNIHYFTIATMILSGFFVIHSLMFSPMPDVSFLKACSWGLAMTALVSLWLGLKPHEFRATSHRLFLGLAFVLIVSLPLLALPPGYAVNGTGFQGILNHPQAFGVTMALFGSWAGARVLGERRPSWGLIALAGSALVAVVLSEARTAGVGLILGLGLALALSQLFTGRRLLQISPGLTSGRVLLTLSGCLIAGLALAPALSRLATHFLSKSNRATGGNLLDAYDASRGFLIDAMMANIAEDPLRGIGFGIASTPSMMVVQRDPIFGLPIGAAVEKGVMPLAVLEELGVIGAALVAGWLILLLRRAASGGLAPFAVCMTALLVNMGENILFSPGGQGLLILVLLGWAYASGSGADRHVQSH